MREIFIGRDLDDMKRFGMEGAAFLAKHYVKTGDAVNLSGNILMDVARPHVMLVCGKRGTGKSYTLGTIAEEISLLPERLKNKMAVVLFDTMGIYWTMKFPNKKDAELLQKWGLEPKATEVNIIVPHGFVDSFKKAGVPVDTPFSLKLSELTAADLCMTFGFDLFSSQGVLIDRTIKNLKETKADYTLSDMITALRAAEGVEEVVKRGVENRLLAAEDWGIFHEAGTPLNEIVKPGMVNILDISVYGSAAGGWSVRSLVVGLIVKKVFNARLIARKMEELEAVTISRGERIDRRTLMEEYKTPMVWFVIDEAHEMMPVRGTTPALDPLLQLIREGRQPGLTLIAATQQPGKIHTDMLSQCDLVLAHRVTSVPDIEALNKIMGNYMVFTLEKYMSSLPRSKGSAILLDDNSEKIYAVRTRPRLSWHGGESATMFMNK